VIFDPGETSKSVPLTICGDAIDEPGETLTVTLANPSGGAVLGAHPRAVVTITELDTTPCTTILAADVPAGSTTLVVVSQSGCALRDQIAINPGGQNEEHRFIVGFGSIIVDQPTSVAHLAGEVVVRIATVEASPRSAPVKEEQTERPRRLTETERQQHERTNRSGLDDARTEGNVLAVGCDAAVPTITIANRDGPVEVRLLGEAAAACRSAEVGDYLEVDGVKQTEQLYEADTITVRRAGQRVH
jgi:hypothetical protein